MSSSQSIAIFLVVSLWGWSEGRGESFETSFAFQSQLDKNGSPLNGATDCRFELFAEETGGMALGSLMITEVVSDGLLTVKLDFGVDIFDGQARWIEVSLRHPHDPMDLAPYTTLSPRQSISPTPYALQTRGIFVDQNEKVSIGVQTERPPISKFRVRGDVADPVAMLAESPATMGDVVGIKGITSSAMGRGVEGIGPGEGVRGTAHSATGTARGVWGVSESSSGEGVFGHAMSRSGSSAGVKGISDSPDGKGVFGEAVGNGTGVVGMAETEGVRGEATNGTGVCGMTSSTSGNGVLGHAMAGSGNGVGVKGMSGSATGVGVVGESMTEGVRGMSTSSTGASRGVCGLSASSSGEGVLGHATSGLGAPIGVKGVSESGGGFGVRGESPNGGFGVWGETAGTGAGVVGVTNSNGFGVEGRVTSTTDSGIGVFGWSPGSTGQGVVGTGGSTGVSGKGTSATGVSHGVVGQSMSTSSEAAGVKAIGNGAVGTGVPQAAALQISEGAITVGGGIRPAGRVQLGSTWTAVVDCASDTIGYTQDVDINNDLITNESLIWGTVELAELGDAQGRVFTLHVFEKQNGSAKFRITAFGKSGGPMCSAPSAGIERYVNYLIINPLP